MSAAVSAAGTAPTLSAAAGGTGLPVWLPATVTRWTPEITAAATRYGVDPALVAIVTTVESCGLRGAVSPSGALGLMQVVPKYHPRILQGDPQDAAHNLDVGTAFLGELLAATGGDVTRAVCQYNGGGNCAALAESQRYMRWVGGMWAERDQSTSATYDAWMAAIRATPNNVCQRAAAEARP
jgi:soluble lytic murein transglycosylase-like protein